MEKPYLSPTVNCDPEQVSERAPCPHSSGPEVCDGAQEPSEPPGGRGGRAAHTQADSHGGEWTAADGGGGTAWSHSSRCWRSDWNERGGQWVQRRRSPEASKVPPTSLTSALSTTQRGHRRPSSVSCSWRRDTLSWSPATPTSWRRSVSSHPVPSKACKSLYFLLELNYW